MTIRISRHKEHPNRFQIEGRGQLVIGGGAASNIEAEILRQAAEVLQPGEEADVTIIVRRLVG